MNRVFENAFYWTPGHGARAVFGVWLSFHRNGLPSLHVGLGWAQWFVGWFASPCIGEESQTK